MPQPRTTIRHEAAHQLCAESRPTSPLAGEACGFWAIEAVACYLEAAEPAAWGWTVGWTVGGPDAGRMPAARRLLIEDGFHVPLEELASLGRAHSRPTRGSRASTPNWAASPTSS